MPKGRKVFSGVFVISILVKQFDFEVVSQRGSHVKLRNARSGRTTIVPLHKELAPGTLKSILELAGLTGDSFQKALER